MIISRKKVSLQILQTEKIFLPPEQEQSSQYHEDQEHQETTPQPLLECRICLEQMNINELQEICHCKGNTRAIHNACLLEWIRKSNKSYRDKLFRYFYNCEICEQQIELETQIVINCVDFSNNAESNDDDEDDNEIIATMIIILLVAIVVVGFSMYAMMKEVGVRFATIGLSVGIATIFVDVLVYVVHSFMQICVVITGVKEHKNKNKQNKGFIKGDIKKANNNKVANNKNNKELHHEATELEYRQKQKHKLNEPSIRSSSELSSSTILNNHNDESIANLEELFAE